MSNPSPVKMQTYSVQPSVGSPFTIAVPRDWQSVELGVEARVDFGESDLLQPLAVYAPPEGGASVTVSARPKFAQGSLHEWAAALCRQDDLKVLHTTKDQIGASPVVICLGTKSDPDLGTLRACYALFEDGGVLYGLAAMGPEQKWEQLAPIMEQALLSFRLLDPKGPTTEAPVQPQAPYDELTYAHFATADTPDSFAADNPANKLDAANESERAPNAWEVNADEKWGAFDFRSIDGIVQVPFGWNISDDGKTGRLFDLANERVIALSWLAGQTDPRQAFEGILAPLKAKHPALEVLKGEFDGNLAVALSGMEWRGRAFRQIILLKQISARPEGLLKLELSAAPDDAEKLLVLARFILRDVRIA